MLLKSLHGFLFILAGLALMATTRYEGGAGTNTTAAWRLYCDRPSDCDSIIKLLQMRESEQIEAVGSSEPSDSVYYEQPFFAGELIYSPALAKALRDVTVKPAIFDLTDEELLAANIIRIDEAWGPEGVCEEWGAFKFCRTRVAGSWYDDLDVFTCTSDDTAFPEGTQQQVFWHADGQWRVFYNGLNLTSDDFIFLNKSGESLPFMIEDLTASEDYGFQFLFDDPDSQAEKLRVLEGGEACVIEGTLEVVREP